VLLTNPSTGRANALYVETPDYDRLLAAVGTDAKGEPEPPPGVASDHHETVRLNWLVHDVRAWRTDTVHLTGDDGIWVGTFVDLAGDGDLFDQPARWYRPQDGKALTSLLTRLGLLGTAAEPSTAHSPSVAPHPSESGATAAAGLGGLIIGTAGTLILRRSRTDPVPRVTLSG
jgi:hypothetical protein